MERLYIGTAGWQYPEWKETFYPKGMPQAQYLQHYSSIFNAVELNSSYYRLPRQETIIEWKLRTPKDFLICPRLIQAISFEKKVEKGAALLKAFLGHFQTLEERLGPIIIEMPPAIAFENENVKPFLDMLGRFSQHYTFVLEPRHISWTNPEASSLCEEQSLTWSISDFCGEFPTIQRVIGEKVYLRFHGTKDLKHACYERETLERCAEKVKHWLDEGKIAYVFFSNHFGGFALENAIEFQDLMMHFEKHS